MIDCQIQPLKRLWNHINVNIFQWIKVGKKGVV